MRRPRGRAARPRPQLPDVVAGDVGTRTTLLELQRAMALAREELRRETESEEAYVALLWRELDTVLPSDSPRRRSCSPGASDRTNKAPWPRDETPGPAAPWYRKCVSARVILA